MDIRNLQLKAHEMSRSKGFWDSPRNVPEMLMLAVSELAEALECYRSRQMNTFEKDGKPEGFGVELADAVIRIADMAEGLNINLSELIALKMGYNANRPYKHGKKA